MSIWRGKDDAVHLDTDNRGFQYGDGVFETIAVRHGKPRLWNYHMRRLGRACERLGLTLPTSIDAAVTDAIESTLEDRHRCVVKVVVTAAPGQRGYGREMPGQAETFVTVFPATELERSAYRHGIVTRFCDTRLAVGSPFAGLKTLNRLEQVLARSELRQTDALEGFTFDVENRLICGTMSNVFLVRDNAVATPALQRCGVEGVMRQLVLDLAPDIEVGDLVLADLQAADEVFITNSQIGLVPVSRCGDHSWPVGPVTLATMRKLADQGIEECHV
jgi:4-amino-4-deoxychorismate lyase